MQPPLPDESRLLHAIANGNQLAFHELMLSHKDFLYTVCIRSLKQHTVTEDCLQDIFLKIWIHREKLREVENFGAWLNTVTRNTLFTALKKKARERALLAGRAVADFTDEETVEDLFSRKENAHLLHAAIQSLSPRQKQLWHLIKEEGLKREVAAERLQISSDTVKFHLSEAYKRIRAYIIEHGDIGLVIIILLKS